MNFRFLQYKHMRRYMDIIDFSVVKIDSYKIYKINRQENDYNIKKSFSKNPCIEPYKEYKLIRQSNESLF